MSNQKFITQGKLLDNHLKNIGAINTDEARKFYSIVDVPTVISQLSKKRAILHRPISRPHPVTGKIRGIVEYSLAENNAE
jgi:hypothetical protein